MSRRDRQPALGRVLVVIPTYNERENIEPIVERLRAAVPDGRRAGRRRRSAPTAPARSPTSSPRPTTTSTCCTAPARTGLGAAYIAGFALGLRARLRRAGRDGRRRLAPARAAAPAARRRSATPTWSSARAGSPAAAVVNWPPHRASCSRAAATSTPGWRSGMPLRDATGGYRAFRRPRWSGIDLPTGRLAGLLLPGRPGLARRRGRAAGRRGADHVRRAGPRRVAR